MNSCLYECDVMHYRLAPRKNQFVYRVFMFYLDLEELEVWHRRLKLFSRNRANLFSFRETDHLQRQAGSTRDNVEAYAREHGVSQPIGRIMLLTHLRTFGHIFNPVSFYYCFDTEGRPLCAVAEVVNTYREMKPYFLGLQTFENAQFRSRMAKNFYVSPFIDLDVSFDFRLGLPDERLAVYVDDYKDGHKVLLSSLTGSRRPLTDAQLAWYTLRFPLMTVQVISLIHWQAFKLWLKGLPYLRKSDHPELQQEVYHARHSS